MTNRIARSGIFLPLCLLAGCSTESGSFDDEREGDPAVEAASQTSPAATSLPVVGPTRPTTAPTPPTATAVPTFTFDSRPLAARPTAGIPQDRLTRAAYDSARVAKALVQSGEEFKFARREDGREALESGTFDLEVDARKGSILVLRKTPDGPVVPQDDALLARVALARVKEWAIPSSEIDRILTRRGLREDQDTAATGASIATGPTLHRYKTFIFRGIGGIPVEGHRAVITHGTDGRFVRALVRWPALASTGHKLRSALTVADIQASAESALTREGIAGGEAVLHWKYVPTLDANGETVLTLKAGARIKSSRASAAGLDEPKEVDVDVKAQ